MYHEENQGRLVLNFVEGTLGNPQTYHSTGNSWISGSALWNASPAGIRQGALWPLTRNERIYRCPSDKTLWPYEITRAPRPWNLVLSIYLNGHWQGVNVPAPVKASELRPQDRCFTFIDEEETLLTSGAFVLLLGHTNSWWTVPGARDRSGGANVAFADGHVEFHKWKYPNRIRTGHELPIANAEDLEDLRWLLSRVPGAR
jgi:prepilin-type processing-associated H-X9-DG protein